MREERTLKHQLIELAKIREWLIQKLRAESDEDIRHCLFEAQHEIGFALLQLERVEFLRGDTYPWMKESLDT